MIVDIPNYDGIGVYKITHTISGRVYIGSSLNCSARLKRHNKHPQNKKMDADSILGPFTAEIIKAFPDGCTNRELAEAERYYCKLFQADTDKGYNDHLHSYNMHNSRRGDIDAFVLPLTVPKGQKAIISEHAEKRGESVNGFIQRAIKETMARDNQEDK